MNNGTNCDTKHIRKRKVQKRWGAGQSAALALNDSTHACGENKGKDEINE
jgi:hypothetical protein